MRRRCGSVLSRRTRLAAARHGTRPDPGPWLRDAKRFEARKRCFRLSPLPPPRCVARVNYPVSWQAIWERAVFKGPWAVRLDAHPSARRLARRSGMACRCSFRNPGMIWGARREGEPRRRRGAVLLGDRLAKPMPMRRAVFFHPGRWGGSRDGGKVQQVGAKPHAAGVIGRCRKAWPVIEA